MIKYIDKQEITIGSPELHQCVEPLFNPSIIGAGDDKSGIAHMIHQSIAATDASLVNDLYCNIILSGGNTLVKNVDERLHRDLRKLIGSPNRMMMIRAPPERLTSSWIGGSILASLSSFNKLLITIEEYNEVGPSVVLRKCL